jgi:hypothetical protein
MESESRWYHDHRLWLELFVLANLAFLAPDIYLAHSMNSFRHPAESIPWYFSLAAPGLLLVGLVCRERLGRPAPWRWLGYLVGGAAVAVGVAGLLWHLESQFFQQGTLASLVYTAPVVAPLAYAGVGLLLILNRMVDPESAEWPMWVLLLALGGFVGNFLLSVTDHAQNGFFYWEEWIPVASSANAVGALLVPFVVRVGRPYLGLCVAVLLVQAAVGVLGFYYHTARNLAGPEPGLLDNFIWGTPALAPLLFPNLVLLAFIGLAVLRRHLPPAAG